jgi:thioredoxin-related protein
MRKSTLGLTLAASALLSVVACGVFAAAAPKKPYPNPSMNQPKEAVPGGGTNPQPAPAPAPAVNKPGANKPGAKKPVVWMENFLQAQRKAQKEEKPMLLYFCGTGWDDYTTQLEEEVMNTPLWADWAQQNMILVKIDYPKADVKQRPEVKNQNDAMKTRFSIAKVPTFIFLDPWGELLSRVGYSKAQLRPEEAKDEPKAWLKYCQDVIASRPAKEKLVGSPTLKAAVAASRKAAIPLCILITQTTNNQVAAGWTETILQNQLFLRFINRNMAFYHLEWPLDTDTSENAVFVRDFATKWKFGPSPFGLVIWSPAGLGDTKAIIGGFDPVDCGPIIKRLEPMLPTIDYNGGWIEDWKAARAVSAQQQRDLFVSFVCTDGSEYSKKMQEEIYDQPEFKDYAKKNLVLLRVDFPSKPENLAKQSKELQEQNRILAEMYGVRGYPQIVVLNPKGQKIIDIPKYMKGGAPLFVSEMTKQIMKDKDRRTLISEEAAKDLEKSR